MSEPLDAAPAAVARGHDHAARPSGHGHDHDHAAGGHGHAHGGVAAAVLGSREAMRTLWRSLVILGLTAAIQLVVVVVSGSVALLADTVHNVGDALTAVPLGVAFVLGRRRPTRRLTYGFGRVEDFAGIAVVVIILISAIVAAYEAIDRLINPHTPHYLLATAIAGVIGFIGNEWVAVYRIRSGRRIGSAALEADGYHARIDGFTSLAVVVGVIGVALGVPEADPIIGLLISAAIVRIVWQSARAIGLRALDGIDPQLIDELRTEASEVPGVLDVQDVRARWLGHVVLSEMTVTVDGDRAAHEASAIAEAVRHRITDNVEHVGDATVQIRTAPDGASGSSVLETSRRG
jgi:cation diffusion facilitator family transporter